MIERAFFRPYHFEVDEKKQAVERVQALLGSMAFIDRHRLKPKAFTRKRALPFAAVVVLILQKGVKSLQLRLNEFFDRLDGLATKASASAFTQARAKLSHRAFIELNEKALVEVLYSDQAYQRWRGFRLVAVDGSKLRLPDSDSIRADFGTVRYAGTGKKRVEHEHPMAVTSVLYDLLNEVALDSVIAPGKSYEVDLALGHLRHLQEDDLLLADRHFATYLFLASLTQARGQFVIRCSRASFSVARAMFDPDEPASQVVSLACPKNKRSQINGQGLPLALTVRFVRVWLETGEPEILVTSLLDEQAYPVGDFQELYFFRWGIETYYGRVKERLELAHFSGQTAESVKQDFYATVFLTSLESMLIDEAQTALAAKSSQNTYAQKVNKAVSFNAIKNHAIALFYQETDPEVLLAKLTRLFMSTPVLERPGRRLPRRRRSAGRRLHYHRYRKKHCF